MAHGDPPSQGPAATPPMHDAPWRVEIQRGGGDGAPPRSYRVPRAPRQTVLDLVTWVQRHLEPDLAYRFACRVGMCGSCAMTVNGTPRWTCRTHAAAVAQDGCVRLGPLRNLPVIKDLVVDMAPFFDKWQRADGVFRARERAPRGLARVAPASAPRRAADAGIECISCAVCYAACDVVAWHPDYLGPAALNRAWTLVNDVRDAERGVRLRAVGGNDGCHCCHTHESCSRLCPKAISPTAAIAGLKRETVRGLLRGATRRRHES